MNVFAAETAHLTNAPNQDMVSDRVSKLLFGGYRPRKYGGIFVPDSQVSLWRECGNSNVRDCPNTVLSSRRQGGLKASLAVNLNASLEANMTPLPQAESAQTSHTSNLFDIINNQEMTLGRLHAYFAAFIWTQTSDHKLRDALLDAFDAIVNELIEQNDQLSKEWKEMKE